LKQKSRVLNRKSWSCLDQPDGCGCQCHAIAAGKARGKKKSPTRWTPSRDAQVLAMFREGRTQKEIADTLYCSPQAVRHRLMFMGESSRAGWRSEHEVGRALGVSWRFTRRWRLDGQLKFRAHDSSTWHRIADAHLEAFVREYAGILFDPQKVRDPSLRMLAEVSATANRRQPEAVS
jgi:hypothetical protein